MAWNRRQFLKRTGVTALGTVTAAGAYPFLEAKWCRTVRRVIKVPNLPPAFRETTLVFLADIHHGPYVPLSYVRHIVETANALRPDLMMLGGDYISRDSRYVAAVMAALAELRAPLSLPPTRLPRFEDWLTYRPEEGSYRSIFRRN